MAWLQARGTAWAVMGLAVVAAVGLLVSIPPEATLGHVIWVIFLHGALVQVGLLLFAAAGVLGLVYLVKRTPRRLAWLQALQAGAVTVWVAYALSSMISTYLAWGQWLAWDEPRVRASAGVLWFAIACLVLVRWVAQPTFTALTNAVLAGVVWTLIKGATIFRHPFNPIGTSDSGVYQAIFIALIGVVALFALALVRTFHTAPPPAAD